MKLTAEVNWPNRTPVVAVLVLREERMFNRQFWTKRRITGAVLVVGFLLLAGGGIFFIAGQGGFGATLARDPVVGLLKSNLLSAGMVVTALGLVLLEACLREAGDHVLSRLGMVSFLLAAGLWLVAEALSLGGRGWVYPLERDYLLLSCFSMACYGGALLRTRLLSRPVAWLCLVWGIMCLGVGFLSFLPPLIANPVSLPIGILLLLRRYQASIAQQLVES
jgi:hypothetical protein